MPSPGDDGRRPVSQRVWTWLARLHTLTAGASSADEAKARIDLVAGLLAQRFPEDVFTERSLEEVASRCRFWPAYGELVDGLRDFTNTYVKRPIPPLLPAPADASRAPPDASELQHVRGAIEGLMRDLAAARVKQEEAGPAVRPLADVTAKGDVLARIRASGRKVTT